IFRTEQIYPLPEDPVCELVARDPNAPEIGWTQEEPANLGAWTYIRQRLEQVAGSAEVRYNGRPERAAPAEGYVSTHEATQREIVQRALTVQRPRRTARKRAQA